MKDNVDEIGGGKKRSFPRTFDLFIVFLNLDSQLVSEENLRCGEFEIDADKEQIFETPIGLFPSHQSAIYLNFASLPSSFQVPH